jgi:hypothetical protein
VLGLTGWAELNPVAMVGESSKSVHDTPPFGFHASPIPAGSRGTPESAVVRVST